MLIVLFICYICAYLSMAKTRALAHHSMAHLSQRYLHPAVRPCASDWEGFALHAPAWTVMRAARIGRDGVTLKSVASWKYDAFIFSFLFDLSIVSVNLENAYSDRYQDSLLIFFSKSAGEVQFVYACAVLHCFN